MGISEFIIYEWRDSGRPVNLADDIEQIWDDSSVLQTFLSTRAYVDYTISQFQHEDFERDCCDHLVSQDGPYADILSIVAEEMESVSDPEWLPMFDSFSQYMTSVIYIEKDGEWVGTEKLKYISDFDLKVFFFRYLDSFLKVKHRRALEDVPDDLISNFKKIMKPKIFETLIALAN